MKHMRISLAIGGLILGLAMNSYGQDTKDSLKIPKSSFEYGFKCILLTDSLKVYKDHLHVIDGKIFKHHPGHIKQQDVASIHILKPYTAMAIYGKEASGGAILITTKAYKTRWEKAKNE